MLEKTRKIGKGAIESEALIWMLVGLAVLVISIILIVALRGKGISALDYIKNLFRFGK